MVQIRVFPGIPVPIMKMQDSVMEPLAGDRPQPRFPGEAALQQYVDWVLGSTGIVTAEKERIAVERALRRLAPQGARRSGRAGEAV